MSCRDTVIVDTAKQIYDKAQQFLDLYGAWTQFLGASQQILDMFCTIYEISWLLDKVPGYSKHIYRKNSNVPGM